MSQNELVLLPDPDQETASAQSLSDKLRCIPVPKEFHDIEDEGINILPEKLLLFVRYGRIPDQTIPLSLHHRFVLIFNFKGEGTFFIDNEKLPFSPGQAILLFPLQLHGYILHQKEREWLYITFCLSDSSHLSNLAGSPVEINSRLRHWIEQITDVCIGTSGPDRLSRAKCLLSLALLEMAESSRQETTTAPIRPISNNPAQTQVEDIITWILRNIGRPISVGDISSALDIPYDHCRALFKRYTGTALSAFIEEIRARRATSLLKHTDRNMKEIAEECGYGTQHNFSRSYKRKTGLSPKQIRTGAVFPGM